MRSRAGIFRGVGQPLEVVELDLDEPGPTDVVVRMAAVGICGTDLHSVRGEWQRPTPIVLGHEGAGVVERVGAARRARSAVGDEVVLSWAPSCGVCADCARGPPGRAACRCSARSATARSSTARTGMSLDGETVYRGTATGALAERVVVAERVALPTGGAMPLEHAALLGCAALTGVGAVLFAGARRSPARRCSSSEPAASGSSSSRARASPAPSSIVVVDPLPERRAQALSSGATHAVDARGARGDDARAGRSTASTTRSTRSATRRRPRSRCGTRAAAGTTVIVGLPAAGQRLDLDPAELIRREKHLTGTMYGAEDPAVAMPILLEHVRAGRLELARWSGRRFPLSELNEAIAASIAGVPGRMLVNPGG